MTDVVYFKHQYVTMPTYTKADAIATTTQDLMKVLTQDVPSHIGQKDNEKLMELANIFNRVATKLPMQEAEKKVPQSPTTT